MLPSKALRLVVLHVIISETIVNIYSRFVTALLLLVLFTTQSLYADVDKGYTWLAAQQQTNGSVERTPSLVLPIQSTAEAILAFNTDDNATGLNKVQAQAFIATNTQLSTQLMANAYSVGITQDAQNNNLLERLKAHQNDDGGFGSFVGYDSNVLDTTLALQVLAVNKSENLSIARSAVNYLIGKQAGNGSFELYLSNTASVSLTAIAANALQPYSLEFSGIPEVTNNAAEYLLNNTSMGDDIESNWLIATALLAIIPSVRDSVRYADLISALKSNQLDNGSWNNDVYTTALAIQALQLAANITFPPETTTGILSGRVTDSAINIPLKNVAINIAGKPEYSTQTDTQGRFELKGLLPANYSIEYQAAGYQSATQSVEVVVAQVTNIGDIQLQKLPDVAVVSGVITDAKTNQVISTAKVAFTKDNIVNEVLVDASGQYSLTLQPGSYSFAITANGYQSYLGDATVLSGNNVTLSPELLPIPDVSNEPKVKAFGLVVDQASNTPIVDAKIKVGGIEVLSDVNGKFELNALNAGDYIITVTAQGFTGASIRLQVTAGNEVDLGTIALTSTPTTIETAIVFGTVVSDANNMPLENALIKIQTQEVRTSTDGKFRIESLTAGSYNASISAPGYIEQRFVFSAAKGSEIDFGSVALKPVQVVIRGILIDAITGEAISGAAIQVLNKQAASDTSGKFVLNGLKEGESIVDITAQGYLARSFKLIAPQGNSQTNFGTIVLTPVEEQIFSALIGKVTDNNTHEPINGAKVLIEETGAFITTESTGQYQLSDIALKRFSLLISAPGYWSQSTRFELSAVGSTNLFDIQLTRAKLDGFTIEQLNTDRPGYGAYQPVMITANIVNASDLSKSITLLLEIFDEDGQLVNRLPLSNGPGGTSEESYILLPNTTRNINASWYTAAAEPGQYRLKLSAYDRYTSQLLSEQLKFFTVVPTALLDDAKLIVNTPYSNVDATDNIKLSFYTVNRSNIPVALTIDYQWLAPDNTVLQTGSKTLNLTPEQVEQNTQLSEQMFTFTQSGMHPFNAQLQSNELTANVQPANVAVAPSTRVQVIQKLTPSQVLPDGNKRITIDITVKGEE